MENFAENFLNWAVLCPGPSLSKKQVWQHNSGCLIAVNGAIDICLPAYWAVMDPHVFPLCRNSAVRCAQHSILWTHKNFEHCGLSLCDRKTGKVIWGPEDHAIFRTWECEMYDDLKGIFQNDHEICWRENTFFSALALAILKGAKHIRIYGADMFGTGYFKDGLTNCRTKHTPSRWNFERKIFKEITQRANAQNIRIERYI